MFDNRKNEQEVSQKDIIQSKRDIKAVQNKLNKLDNSIPASNHVSAEYLLSKEKRKRKQFPLQTAIMVASAAAIVLVVGSVMLLGPMLKASSKDEAMMVPESAEQEFDNTTGSHETPKDDADVEEESVRVEADDNSDQKEQGGTASVYTAGSYTRLLDIVQSAAGDFSHIISTNATKSENEDEYGIIGSEVVGFDCEIVLQTGEEFQALSAMMLEGERRNVFTYGNKRVFSVFTEEIGELIGIEDTASGELLSVIKMGVSRTIERIVLDDDKLVVIGLVTNDEENPAGAFDATLVSVFNLADAYLPVKDERFAAEGELFTVITNSGDIFVVIRRFAVGRMNMSTMEIEGMDYIPVFLYNSTVDRIAPSNIYISSEMASMDYLIAFKVDGEEAETMAYLGAADPLVAVNYLIEKMK